MSNGDWNLILDADEFIININFDAIKEFMKSNDKVIGLVKIVNLLEQDGEIKKSNSFISRLAPKGVYFSGRIHEQLDSSLPRKIVDIELEHDSYLYTDKFERNISLILSELKENSNDSYLLYQAAKTYYTNKMYYEASPYFDTFYNNFNADTDAFVKDTLILYLYNIIKTNQFEKGLHIIDDNFDMLNMYCYFYFVCGVFFTELVASNPEKYLCYFDSIELSYLNALQLGENDNFSSVQGTGTYLTAFNLGIFYELTNNIDKSLYYYKLSAEYNYSRAVDQINKLKTKL